MNLIEQIEIIKRMQHLDISIRPVNLQKIVLSNSFIEYLFDKYDVIFSETNLSDGCREIRMDFDFNDWAKDFMIKNKDPSIIVYYISHYGRKYIYIADKLKGQYDIMEFKEKEKI